MEARANIPTANASRYLQQLCKHWSHRMDVTFTPLIGRVPFAEDANCVLEATPEALGVAITAPDAATLQRLQGVVFSHLARFATSETLPTPDWRTS